ncbi:MAG: MFS transporter [Chitinophagales bacterium]|nr:MFS transporter [Chitinophagales bacterium]
MNTSSVTKVPIFIKVMYSFGQAGWNLANACLMLLLIYFYIPPGGNDVHLFPEYIERNTVFFSFTIVGILMFVGMLLSAVMDIIMGPLSDRAKLKFGRRRSFLAIAFIPLTVCMIMAFYPPVEDKSVMNVIWLATAVLVFNVFVSVYVTPYNGLIAELGHTEDDRVFISTLLAITWGIGFVGANTIFALKGWVSSTFDISGVLAFKYLILAFASLSCLLMLMPIIFVNENKYCIQSEPVEGNPFQQMKSVLKIQKFRRYMICELFYWISTQFVQLGVAYYITVLIGLEEHYITYIIIGVAACSGLSFPLIIPLTKKFGKKFLLVFAFVMQSLLFLFIMIMGHISIPTWLILVAVILLNTLPMAIFGILPMALISDMATEDAQYTGKMRSATFFGVKFFVMKIGLSITSLVFPTLLLLGNSIDNPKGVDLTAVAGLVGAIIALFLMTKVDMPHLIEE